jgi:hypothetical protein
LKNILTAGKEGKKNVKLHLALLSFRPLLLTSPPSMCYRNKTYTYCIPQSAAARYFHEQ